MKFGTKWWDMIHLYFQTLYKLLVTADVYFCTRTCENWSGPTRFRGSFLARTAIRYRPVFQCLLLPVCRNSVVVWIVAVFVGFSLLCVSPCLAAAAASHQHEHLTVREKDKRRLNYSCKPDSFHRLKLPRVIFTLMWRWSVSLRGHHRPSPPSCKSEFRVYSPSGITLFSGAWIFPVAIGNWWFGSGPCVSAHTRTHTLTVYWWGVGGVLFSSLFCCCQTSLFLLWCFIVFVFASFSHLFPSYQMYSLPTCTTSPEKDA